MPLCCVRMYVFVWKRSVEVWEVAGGPAGLVVAPASRHDGVVVVVDGIHGMDAEHKRRVRGLVVPSASSHFKDWSSGCFEVSKVSFD